MNHIDQIPLLEDLCEAFQREIFLGSLPTEKFSSYFRRFPGGSLQACAPPNGDQMNRRRGRRAIEMPARLPSGPDKKRTIMPGEMSLFYQLQNNQSPITIDFWARLYTGKHSGAIPKSELQSVLTQVSSAPLSEPLNRLSTVVLDEFTGRLPIAAIKYHAICDICPQILNEMAVLAIQAQDQPVEHASPANGFKFVETLLVAIVEHQRGPVKVKILPYLVSFPIAHQPVVKFCAGKSLAEFVWTF